MTSRSKSACWSFPTHASKHSPCASKSMHSRFPDTAPATMHTPSCAFENQAPTSTSVGRRLPHVFHDPTDGRFFCRAAGRTESPAERYDFASSTVTLAMILPFSAAGEPASDSKVLEFLEDFHLLPHADDLVRIHFRPPVPRQTARPHRSGKRKATANSTAEPTAAIPTTESVHVFRPRFAPATLQVAHFITPATRQNATAHATPKFTTAMANAQRAILREWLR